MDSTSSRSSGLIFSAVALIAVSYALFADYLPGVGGAYATRRWILCWLLVATVLSVLVIDSVSVRNVGFFRLAAKILPLILLLMIGGYRSPFPEFAYVEPLLYTMFIVAVVTLGSTLSRLEDRIDLALRFLFIVFIACGLYAAMSINVYLFALVDGYIRIDHLLPWGFVNIRYWSHLATWLLPLLPLVLLVHPLGKGALVRFSVAAVAAIWWWLLFVSTSRGSIISIVFSMFMVAILFRWCSLPWLRLMFLHLLFGVAVWLLLSVLLPALMSGGAELRGIKGHGSGRWPMWVSAVEMGVENFPLGAGALSWLMFGRSGPSSEDLMFAHPHNMYLYWIAEYGFLITIAFFLGAASFVSRFLQRLKNGTHSEPSSLLLMAGLTASVIGGFTHAGVSAIFIAPASMLVGFLVLGLFGGLVAEDQNPYGQESTSLPSFIKPVITGFFLGVSVTWLVIVGNYYHAMQEDLHHYSEVLKEANMPRFWYHGHFPRREDVHP